MEGFTGKLDRSKMLIFYYKTAETPVTSTYLSVNCLDLNTHNMLYVKNPVQNTRLKIKEHDPLKIPDELLWSSR
jgi:hypothetical protein